MMKEAKYVVGVKEYPQGLIIEHSKRSLHA
jgi:hypothetical protein